jgi:hypothetical protein
MRPHRDRSTAVCRGPAPPRAAIRASDLRAVRAVRGGGGVRASRERELSTIVVLHDLNGAARFADTIALLHEGRLRAVGDPGAIVTPTIMRDVFGVGAHVARGVDGVPTVTGIRPA